MNTTTQNTDPTWTRYFAVRADCPDAYLYDHQFFGPTVSYPDSTGYKIVVVQGWDERETHYRAEYLRGRINSGSYCSHNTPIYETLGGVLEDANFRAELTRPVSASVQSRKG